MKNEYIDELLKNVENADLPGIYLIENIDTGKKYVGQTKKSLKERLTQHILNIKAKEGRSESIDKAIQIEGPEKFKYSKLLTIPEPTESLLNEAEKAFITVYDSKNKGYNLTKGNHSDWKGIEQRHLVTEKIIKLIIDEFRISFKDKKVLLIGNFDESLNNHLHYERACVKMIDRYGIMNGNEILEEVKELSNEKFDIILSNPPYNTLGIKITECIRDNIEFRQFINLMPINDYLARRKLRRENTLYKNVKVGSLIIIKKGFCDAAVTTAIAEIIKSENLFVSRAEFEAMGFNSDSQLNKYVFENAVRRHYAVGNHIYPKKELIDNDYMKSSNNTFIVRIRDEVHGHLPFDKTCNSYLWNTSDNLDTAWVKANFKPNGWGDYPFACIKFETPAEKSNFSKFMYSDEGFRFISKVFTASPFDNGLNQLSLPKVDWSKEWTVEEILKDYNYSDKEIEEVMEDLKNFKGMND